MSEDFAGEYFSSRIVFAEDTNFLNQIFNCVSGLEERLRDLALTVKGLQDSTRTQESEIKKLKLNFMTHASNYTIASQNTMRSIQKIVHEDIITRMI